MTAFQKYLELNYGIDANTTATIFITIFIFFIGLVVQQMIVIYNSYNERRKTRKIFKISLKSFVKQVKKQADEYQKTSQTFTFDKESNFEFNRASISTISSLNNLGFQRTYEAYFFGIENMFKCHLDFKLKAFNKIWDAVKSVEYWHDKSFQDVSDFINKYNTFNERRNRAVDNHRRYFEPIMTSISGKTVPKNLGLYLRDADQIHFDWQNYPNRTRPNVVHKQLITRLRILNRENQDLDVANVMNNNLLEASMEFQNQHNLLKAQKIQFVSYGRMFRLYSRIAKKTIEIL